MKLYEKIGNFIFDYIILTFLIIVLSVLVIPIYGIFLGVISYFDHDRSIKYIFISVKENIINIIKLTIIIIIIFILIYLTVVIEITGLKSVLNIISRYVLLAIFTLIIITTPIILINMNVTFKQLIRNSIYISLVYFKEVLIMFVITYGYIILLTKEFLVMFLVLPIIQTIHYFGKKIIISEKEKEQQNEKNI